MIVTVFGKPDALCKQCMFTKKWLTKQGVEFTYLDVTTDEEALAKLKETGYSSAPVVVLTDDEGNHIDDWSEHRTTKLEQYFKKSAAAV
ncbi:thioredoxin [Gordonia phage Pupper]|uniref:Thioredoxin n=1 Tax=Gordonia phage Pupper TaxID=2571249 RepID=A0A4Y6EIL7_9CAUD|nr:thioredoxin [Gordonia phage Pupper]QDF18563.1 thioredoxin [Gordonia phage Pupper]QDF18795.1 thioredoxin [Gordonia phage SCentae]